jgi:hypothetical protein
MIELYKILQKIEYSNILTIDEFKILMNGSEWLNFDNIEISNHPEKVHNSENLSHLMNCL